MTDWFQRAFGAVAEEVGNAASDIRDKLVFESWFGRRTTDHARGESPSHDGPSNQMDFGDWGSGEPSPIAPNPDAEHSRNPEPEPDHGHGIDR